MPAQSGISTEVNAGCDHAFVDYQPADRSVGIMYESWTCEDCGADLTDEARDARDEARAERILAARRGW